METKQKLLFLFAIIISNIFTYLLFFSTPNEVSDSKKIIIRNGYQKIKIKAHLKTVVDTGDPITFSDSNYKRTIKSIFFIAADNSSIDDMPSLDDSAMKYYILEVPNSKALEILKIKNGIILPYSFTPVRKKTFARRNYEVIY